MKDFVFRPRLQILIIIGAASLIFIISFAVVLDLFFSSASSEAVNSWYENELVNIQQGNVLSSVTKLQRTIDRGGLIRGVWILDKNGSVLVNIGLKADLSDKGLSDQPVIVGSNFFKRTFGFQSGPLRIYLISENQTMRWILLLLVLYQLALFIGLGFFLRRVSMQEQKIVSDAEVALLKLDIKFSEKLNVLAKRVAHDIRSPLTALNIVIQNVNEASDEQRSVLRDVSIRINDIANELLTSAKESAMASQSVALRNNIENIQVKIFLEKIVKQKSLEFSENKKVNLVLRAENIKDETVFFPEKELARILSNLINNSVEALRDDGAIFIDSFKYKDKMVIRVIDSGRGISEDLQRQLFTHPVSTKSQGSGIGLFSAHEVMKAHGGDLVLQSKERIGTQITLEFPIPPSN